MKTTTKNQIKTHNNEIKVIPIPRKHKYHWYRSVCSMRWMLYFSSECITLQIWRWRSIYNIPPNTYHTLHHSPFRMVIFFFVFCFFSITLATIPWTSFISVFLIAQWNEIIHFMFLLFFVALLMDFFGDLRIVMNNLGVSLWWCILNDEKEKKIATETFEWNVL